MKLNTKPLAGIEIGFPIIAEGLYHARIEDKKVEPNKKGDGNNLIIKFKILDNPVNLHKDGSQIENKGQLVLTRYFSLLPTPDYDPDKAMKELAVAVKLPEDKDLEIDDLNGIVMLKVAHKPEETDKNSGKKYPEGNDIKRVTPVPPDDTFTPPPF